MRLTLLLLASLTVAVTHPLTAQRAVPRQWGHLTPGRHGVGFRFVAEYDRSRRVAPAQDFEGTPNPGPLAMPMPVAIWYPATVQPGAPHVRYGEFAALAAKRTDLSPVTPNDRRAAIANLGAFAGFAYGRALDESERRVVDTTTTAAVRDATPAAGRFPVVLAATDGSIAAATVLFEYLASHGIAVIATPSRLSYASMQVSRPAAVVEARVRDLEFLLDHARRYPFVDTARVAVLGVNFDGMAALAFEMKNMAARAVVSLDGWEGKAGSVETVHAGLHYDPRRMRVPYLVVLQDEQSPPPPLRLDRSIFDELRYSERQWLVLSTMSHAYLVGNPLVYPTMPDDKRLAYELLVRSIHGFLDDALAVAPRPPRTVATAEGTGDRRSPVVKDAVRRDARALVPDAEELERLIMVDRAVDKVARVLRDARRDDSAFVLFSQQTMALYAFRFTRQNDLPFAIRLLELNAEAFPRSWSAFDALGNGHRDVGNTSKARDAYMRALALLAQWRPPNDSAADEMERARRSIEEKLATLPAR